MIQTKPLLDNNIMQEIERKFLVRDDSFRQETYQSTTIAQGYICSRKVTARIRIYGDMAFLTIKGKSRDGGLSRFEWERPIPVLCATKLLSRCDGVVEKVRHLVRVDGFTYEIDEFKGDNDGLVIAEVELNSVDERPPLPDWILKEVTGVRFYYNSFLAKHPYKKWFQNNK